MNPKLLQQPPAALQAKLDRLHNELLALQPGLLAFSGGVDSRLLAFLASQWALDYKLVFFSGPHISPAAREWALQSLTSFGLPHLVQTKDPLQDSRVAANTKQRCYYCKQHLFQSVAAKAQNKQINILEGTHLSDLQGHRPGWLALQELKVFSPFLSAGLDKADIRLAARYAGLQHPDQPSRPCLLTRFAYSLSPSHGLLARLGLAEDRLQELGLSCFRLRITAPGSFYLQIDSREKAFWSQNKDRVQQILDSEGFPGARTLFSRRISGFFDHAGQPEAKPEEQSGEQ